MSMRTRVANVLGDLVGVVHFGRHQRRHELRRKIRFKISRLVRQHP